MFCPSASSRSPIRAIQLVASFFFESCNSGISLGNSLFKFLCLGRLQSCEECGVIDFCRQAEKFRGPLVNLIIVFQILL